jgi:GntR family transcriptional repressor for pyruvate dehydrogenase complex
MFDGDHVSAVTDLFPDLDVSRAPLHERIADSLQQMIAEKRLVDGSPLPSERDLAQTLGVSRVTMHQAMLVLEQRGLVEIKAGSGVFVTSMPPSIVSDSIERYYAFGGCSHHDLIVFREILEPEIAALAAQHATPEQVATLGAIVDEIEEAFARGDVDATAAADSSFHEVLAAASHNDLILAVVGGLHRTMQSAIHAQIKTFVPAWGIRAHRPVYEAVAARRVDAARTAMRAHMETTRAQLLQDERPAPKL